jgi:hypothetical protein
MLGIFREVKGLLALHEELDSMEFELSDEDAPSQSICTRLNSLCRLKCNNLWKTYDMMDSRFSQQ